MITGTDHALMQCRSGIARAGATRSNYYSGAAVITIDVDGTPTDISTHVAYNGWQITLNLNDAIDTATISLLPSCPFVPQTRAQVRIGLGSANNVAFAGIVLTVQRTRRPGPDPRFWYELTCVDYTALLDAHFVTADYPAQSATTTILDLVDRFCRGAGISTAGVAPGLPTVAGFSVINERPTTVLRRVTNKIGGGFWLDQYRVLRAWSSAIPSPIVVAAPQPLTDDLATLKSFRMTEDASQQRTRVWMEGQRTSTRLAVPAGMTGGIRVPLTDAGVFPDAAAIVANENYARIGSTIGTGPAASYNPPIAGNPPGAVLAVDAGLAPPQSLYFADASMFPASGWVEAAGQVLAYTKDTGDPRYLLLPPLGAYGSLAAPLAAGTQVVTLPWIQHDPHDRYVSTPPLSAPVPTRAQPQGSPAVLVVMREDAATAATIGAREGSDGFYEHLIQDGRYTADGARARADAELADFAPPLVAYAWDTEDLNAEPGRMQHIALVEGTPITDDVRIATVTITPIAPNHAPRRAVTAARVQSASVVDVWADVAE